jgi:hypothetical protein
VAGDSVVTRHFSVGRRQVVTELLKSGDTSAQSVPNEAQSDMAASPHSGTSRPPRSGIRGIGFPPPPKSVRSWQVPASEEIEPEKPALASTGKAASLPTRATVKRRFARECAWLVITLLLITVVLVVMNRVMR